FIAFKSPLDHILIGLLHQIGILLCCVGIFITGPLFFAGHYLIVDTNMTWREAMGKCMEVIRPQLGSWILFTIVIGLVAALGILLCIVGIFFTGPIAACAMAYAYDQTFCKNAVQRQN